MKVLLLSAVIMGMWGNVFAQDSLAKKQPLAKKSKVHTFITSHAGATLEAVRELGEVKLYMMVDDVEQYEKLYVERSDESQTYFTQIKPIDVTPGKYPDNYIEVIDKYPVSSKMTNLYRLKAVTADGITKMFAPVSVIMPSK
jgi:hypothetical protein